MKKEKNEQESEKPMGYPFAVANARNSKKYAKASFFRGKNEQATEFLKKHPVPEELINKMK